MSPSELPAPAGSAPSSERGPELGLQQQKPTIRSPGAKPCLDGQRLGALRTVALRVYYVGSWTHGRKERGVETGNS